MALEAVHTETPFYIVDAETACQPDAVGQHLVAGFYSTGAGEIGSLLVEAEIRAEDAMDLVQDVLHEGGQHDRLLGALAVVRLCDQHDGDAPHRERALAETYVAGGISSRRIWSAQDPARSELEVTGLGTALTWGNGILPSAMFFPDSVEDKQRLSEPLHNVVFFPYVKGDSRPYDRAQGVDTLRGAGTLWVAERDGYQHDIISYVKPEWGKQSVTGYRIRHSRVPGSQTVQA